MSKGKAGPAPGLQHQGERSLRSRLVVSLCRDNQRVLAQVDGLLSLTGRQDRNLVGTDTTALAEIGYSKSLGKSDEWQRREL